MPESHAYFDGPDRLETATAVGRPMRMGALGHLRTSEAVRVRELIAQKDITSALQRVDYLHGLNIFMYQLLVEWCIRWQTVLCERVGNTDGQAAASEAMALVRKGITPELTEAGDVVCELLNPERISQRLAAGSIATAMPQLIEVICKRLIEEKAAISTALTQQDFSAATAAFDKYFVSARARHDLLSRQLWAIPSIVCKKHGQTAAESAMDASWAACSFQDQMWEFFGSLSPLERTAFMAEHLRSHFSGTRREGTVEIFEEPDRFRIKFDPCGSGGAMRQEGHESWAGEMTIFAKASPYTWGRAGEVPAYCSHCAVNEMTSLKKFGHMLWVTEFVPDPHQPCGWTIFKDSRLIPESYFSRLGATKPAGL